MLKHLLTISLTITLLAQTILPTVVFAQSEERRARVKVNPAVMAEIPPFPEVQMEEPEWSEVDWEREIILPKDHEAFMKELEKLDESKDQEKIKALEQSLKKSFSDDAVMVEMGVPQYVREKVKEYYPEKSPQKSKHDGAGGIGTDILELFPFEPQKISEKEKKKLQQQIRAEQVRKKLDNDDLSFSTETTSENTIDAESLEQQVDLQDFSILLKPNEHREAAAPVGEIRIQSEEAPAPQKLKTLQEIQSTPLKTPEETRTSWTDTFFGHLFFKANAQVVLPNLIEPYEGIENHPIDSLLLQLMERQNQDGSFGTDMVYELSANIAFILSDFNRTDNETYQRLISYLQTAPAKNLREKAMKARILISLSLPYGDLMTEIDSFQYPNGGFGLEKYYISDVITTQEVLLTQLSKNAHEYPDSIIVNTQMLKALVSILREVEQDGSMRYRPHGEVSYYLMNRTLEVLQPFSPFELEVDGTMVSVQSSIDVLLQKLASSYDEENQVLSGGNKSVDLLMTLENFQRYQVFPEKQTALKNQMNGRYLSGSIELGHQFEMIAAMRALAQPDMIITSVTPTSSLENDEMANFAVVVKNIGYKPTNQLQLYEYMDRFLVRNGGLNLTQMGVVLQPNQEWTVNVAYNFASPLAETAFDFYIEADQEHTYKNNWYSETFHYDPAPDGSPSLQTYFIATKYETGGVAGLNVRWQVQEDPRRKSYTILFREQGTQQWSSVGIHNSWNGAFIIGLQDGMEYDVTVGVVSTNDEFYWYDTPVRITAGIDETIDTGSINGTVKMDGEPLEGAFLFGYGITARADSEGTFSDGEIQHGTNGIWVFEDHLEDFRQVFPVPKNGVTDGIKVLTKLKADVEDPQLDVVEIRNARTFIVRNQRTVEMLAYGSDNIGFSNADFYYWDPIEQFWNYIGNTSQNCGDCFLYEWYIPQELLGSGYKIKSVVYDYQNNLTEKEWGPFEIVDGAIPSGSVQVLGLQNGEWGLGENLTVEWNIGSNNDLLYQNISLYYGSNSNRLESNYDLSQNSYSYTMPLATTYTTPLNEATIVIEACDVFNSCTEVESDPFTIVDRTPPPQTPWQPNLQEMNGIINGYPIYRTIYSFHHNPDNTLDVVYVESDYSSYDRTTHKLYARKYSNNQWQTPVLIRETMYEYGDTEEFIYSSIQSVRTSNGDLHVVYNEYDQRASNFMNTNEVHYAHISNGSIISSRQVSNSAIASLQPAIRVSDNGKVALLWRTGYDYSTFTGQTVLYFSEGDGLNSWSTPAQFTPGTGRFPSMLYNSEQLYVIYQNEDQYWLIRRTNGINSAALVLNNRQVPRSQLDTFTADQALFDSIVEPDPENPSNYLWREEIRTKSDLQSILNTQGFTEAQGILNVWGKYQFGRNGNYLKFFSSGGNDFELFAQKQDVDVSSFQYNLQHLRFSANFSTQSIEVNQHQLIFDLIPENQVQGFAVAQRPDQNTYHLFYILTEPNGTYTIHRPYHALYDGERTHFTANIASSLLNVSNYFDIYASNINDGIRAYFYSFIGGSEKLIYNSADYSSLIENRFIPVHPEPSEVSTGTDVIFEWQHSGAVADNYELWLGKDRHDLKQEKAGLQQMTTTLMNLDPDASYYWKIVANLGSQKAHSDVWRFKTPSGLPPQISVSYNETELSHEGNFSLGTIQFGNPANFAFEIENTGGGTLQLDDLFPLVIEQDEQEAFSLSSPPASLVLSSGETSHFEMQIDPLNEGTFNATLILKSNDLVTPEFSVNLSVIVQQRTTSSIAGPSDLKHFDASGQVELPMGTLFEETQPTLSFTIRDASETTPYSYIIQVDDDGNFTDGPNDNEGDIHNFTLPAATQEIPEVQYLLPEPLPDGYYYWRARVMIDEESKSLWTYANNGNRAFVLQKYYEFLFNGSIEESHHGGRDITVSGSGPAYETSYDQTPDNRAIFFDGKDDQIMLNHDVSGGDLTFSAWIYPTQNGLKKPLIDRKRYRVEIDENEAVTWSIHDEATDAPILVQSLPLSPGWHHLVATVKSGEYLRLYVDGTLVGEQLGNWNIKTQDFFANEKLTLGGKDSEWYQGGVDEMKIWKKALTENEITSLYTPLPEPVEESLLFSASQLSFSDTIFGEQSFKSLSIQSGNSQTPIITHLLSSCPVYSIQGWLASEINQNTNFDTSVDAWEKWPNEENDDQGRASQLIFSQDKSIYSAGGGSAKIEIQYHSDEMWETQLYQEPISVALQEHYQLSFFAKADQSRSIQAGIHESLQPSSGSIGDLHTLQLTTEWQYFNLPITITKQDELARLQFSLGGTIGSVWLDEVKLQKTTQPLLLDSPQAIIVNFAPLAVKVYECELTVKTLSGKTHTITLSGLGSDMIFRGEDPLFTPLPLEFYLPPSPDSLPLDDPSPVEESIEAPENPEEPVTPPPVENPENPEAPAL